MAMPPLPSGQIESRASFRTEDIQVRLFFMHHGRWGDFSSPGATLDSFPPLWPIVSFPFFFWPAAAFCGCIQGKNRLFKSSFGFAGFLGPVQSSSPFFFFFLWSTSLFFSPDLPHPLVPFQPGSCSNLTRLFFFRRILEKGLRDNTGAVFPSVGTRPRFVLGVPLPSPPADCGSFFSQEDTCEIFLRDFRDVAIFCPTRCFSLFFPPSLPFS